MVWMMGRFTLNASSFFLMLSAERRGPGRSPKVLVSLCMVRHMLPTSSSTCSASSFRKGPVQGGEGGGGGEGEEGGGKREGRREEGRNNTQRS